MKKTSLWPKSFRILGNVQWPTNFKSYHAFLKQSEVGKQLTSGAFDLSDVYSMR